MRIGFKSSGMANQDGWAANDGDWIARSNGARRAMNEMFETGETHDRIFAEALRRACRQPQGRSVLVLHLSRMKPPAPRPHHRRVARAMLQDTANRHEGQVFPLANGDIALLCRSPGLTVPLDRRDGTASAAEDGGNVGGLPRAVDQRGDPLFADAEAGRTTLPGMLARLLRVDAPDPATLISQWPIERSAEPLLRYVRSILSGSPSSAPPPEPSGLPPTRGARALGELVRLGSVRDLMLRQTGVALGFAQPDFAHLGGRPDAADAPSGGSMLRPLYNEASFSIASLEARIGATSPIAADPFLFGHLAGRLDQRMLREIRAELGSGGPLDLLAGREDGAAAPPLYLNLTLEGVRSEAFRALAAECRRAGAPLGVEVSAVEACADIRAYLAARDAARAAGMMFVLDGVSHLALQFTAPAALDADLMKLDWSPRMAELRGAEEAALRTALEAAGPHRTVLHRAETEAAVRWGVRHGIRRFQGRHIDAMLGAGRIGACPRAGACTLRQCVERASATAAGGRAGCANLPLLDFGTPRPARGSAARQGAPASRPAARIVAAAMPAAGLAMRAVAAS